MTRVLLIGDVHMMDKAPSGRTETYPDDIIAKLEWLAGYAKEIGADATVWAGDIFHFKQPSRTSHATVMRMIEAARLFDNLYIIDGNHDMSNDVADSILDKQPLGVLYRSGAALRLEGWHPTLPIYGIPWQQRWLHEGVVEEVFDGWRNSYHDREHSLAITHAPIYPPGMADEQMFELVSTTEIAEAMGHEGYLYYGHIHEDHSFFEVDGVTFGNVGAISRGSLHEYNLVRKVKAAVWTPEDGFSEVEIPHKPAEEVFRIQQAQDAKAEKLSLDNFLAEVGNSTLDISSTESVVAHIQGLKQVEPRVRKIAVEILEGVEV